MSKFTEKIENLEAIKDSIDDILRVEIEVNESIIVQMNAKYQLYEQGITRNGVSISSYEPYKPRTIREKRKKGQPTNRVTLRDEGLFHASFKVVTGPIGFEIAATDWKTEDLVAKYGEQILGLTDENLALLLWDYIYPALVEHIRKNI